MHQGCGFDPQSGHIQESMNERINKWDNKSMFLSLSLPLSVKSINKLIFFNWVKIEKELPYDLSIDLDHFIWRQAFSSHVCDPQMTVWAGLVRASPQAVGGTRGTWEPQFWDWGSESTGLEFAHFTVVILMQIVLRFSQGGPVSFLLCQNFVRVLPE